MGICCLLFFLLLGGSLSAQAQTSPSALSMAEQQALMAQQARQQVTDRILAAGGVPLEGALDPAAYIVGPGRRVQHHNGRSAASPDRPVGDGRRGACDPFGRQLSRRRPEPWPRPRTRISTALQRSYRNVPIEVALAQPRQFYVHVSGEVARPGRHVAVPVARVEDALAAAMEENNPLAALEKQRREYWNYDGLPALRNVTVERQNGERLAVDLMRYYATGDPQYNPYLRDGDRLYVPTFTSDGEAVFVEYKNREILNRMTANGTTRTNTEVYDFRPGDTVTDLLLVAGGPALLGETSTVRLMRNVDGALDVRSVDVQAIVAGTEPDIAPATPRPAPRPGRCNPSWGRRSRWPRRLSWHVPHRCWVRLRSATSWPRQGASCPDGLLRAAYLERRGAAESADRTQSLESVRDGGCARGARPAGGLQAGPTRGPLFR